MNSLMKLQDHFLIEAYQDAQRLNLSMDFINLLLVEISNRELSFKSN
jgi:hypothetical protein